VAMLATDGMRGGTKLMTSYHDLYEKGDKFADFANDVLYANGVIVGMYRSRDRQWSVGESRAGMEIKYDEQQAKTGNLWIETEEKTDKDNPHWIPSGIHATDNRWLYLIGNYHAIWIFSVTMLRLLQPKYSAKEIPTSRGFLLSSEDADKYAARVMKGKEFSKLPWRGYT
jgi:hypothetical protein